MSERVTRNSAYLNGKSTSGTTTRVKDVSPTSGMCPLCIRDCPIMCEISLSAFRGREALYPEPGQYGCSTAGALKDFRLDWSDFNIHASLFGAEGIEPDSDKALFENANIETKVAGIPLKLPILTGAFGSTDVARLNWEGLAVGAALSGAIITVGENIVGIWDGKKKKKREKEKKKKKKRGRLAVSGGFGEEKNGDVVVQTNVED